MERYLLVIAAGICGGQDARHDSQQDAGDTKKAFANAADQSASSWSFGRATPGYNDGGKWTLPGAKYAANAFGLHDMHGNVAEWTLSTYRPDAKDGDAVHHRVVRGGSWNDTLRFCRSGSRWRYAAHRPVYNVGFRVIARDSNESLRASR